MFAEIWRENAALFFVTNCNSIKEELYFSGTSTFI